MRAGREARVVQAARSALGPCAAPAGAACAGAGLKRRRHRARAEWLTLGSGLACFAAEITTTKSGLASVTASSRTNAKAFKENAHQSELLSLGVDLARQCQARRHRAAAGADPIFPPPCPSSADAPLVAPLFSYPPGRLGQGALLSRRIRGRTLLFKPDGLGREPRRVR